MILWACGTPAGAGRVAGAFALAVTLAATVSGGAPVAAAAAGAPPADLVAADPHIGRRPPVPGAVVRPFQAPAHEYGPGHRGVDLAAASADVVRSPAPGTVTFTGHVAGRGVVVVQHADGTLSSLEPVAATVARGTRVVGGSPVAVVAVRPAHAGCVSACLHWGVRVGGRYVDPLWWLGRTRPVRLLPLAGAR